MSFGQWRKSSRSRRDYRAIRAKTERANTLDVTRDVEKRMAELKPAMGAVEYDTTVFRPATFIERALSNLGTFLYGLVGATLVNLLVLPVLTSGLAICSLTTNTLDWEHEQRIPI